MECDTANDYMIFQVAGGQAGRYMTSACSHHGQSRNQADCDQSTKERENWWDEPQRLESSRQGCTTPATHSVNPLLPLWSV